ncbi:AFG1/ZapE family ATPase [Pseudomonas plecoglossicida]|uniref:AFG1/ZapE family ATPase n=1 Tax=Pseudomonas plecoglossicida TaxID=70775 RepID=UPI00048B40F7|nr:AFG1/ZapE family ATPase [Pseudomonas plecoglossicida]GLR39152.1 hypothetical protein GCM10011247_45510 [Pseudomonas plecoglossicida]
MSAWIPSPLRQLGQRLDGASTNQSELLAWFEDKAHDRGYHLSDGQRRVIHSMAEQLTVLPDGQPCSLYLHGSVGRSKSWLLDGFFQAVPIAAKRRLHFHLSECSLAAQQRFVNLVDVLYDQDRQLTVIGRRPLEASLGGAIADLMRTRSRLGQLRQAGPEGFRA